MSTVLPQRVISPYAFNTPIIYTKPGWSDSWVQQPWLYCDYCEEATGSQISSARLSYEYGYILRPGNSDYQRYDRIDINRQHVKIVFTPNTGYEGDVPEDLIPDSVAWYGLILSTEDRRFGAEIEIADGVETLYSRGNQEFTCVGLEWLYTRTTMSTSVLDNNERIGRAITFNAGRGGQHTTLQSRANKWFIEPLFATDLSIADEWTCKDIVKYVIDHHSPRDMFNNQMPFDYETNVSFDSLDAFKPMIHAQGRTVFDVINQAVDPRRGVTWSMAPDAAEEKIVFQTHTFARNTVVLNTEQPIRMISANGSQKTLDLEKAIEADPVIIVTDTGRQYDQVVARGARRGSVFTVGFQSLYANELDLDDNEILVPDWLPASEESEFAHNANVRDYIAGASNETSYSANLEEWIDRNDAIRQQHPLKWCFTRFIVREEWNGRVPDILYAVQPELDDEGSPRIAVSEKFWQAGMQFENYLPLKQGVDYTELPLTKPSQSELYLDELLDPFAVIKIGESSGGQDIYQYVDRLRTDLMSESYGDGGLDFACTLQMRQGAPGIVIVPHGPSHLIAKADIEHLESESFTFEPSNHTPALDYHTMRATVYWQGDTYAEAKYPKTIDVPTSESAGVLIVDVGDRARLDWMVPYTVVGINADGSLQQNDSGGWIRDDRELLRQAARASWEWYSTPRRAIVVTLRQITSQFRVGDLITDVMTEGVAQEINTLVTSVRWDFRAGTTTIRTNFSDLDISDER